LLCDANGEYATSADTGNLVCTINSCDGSVINGGAGADYSSCAVSTVTGDTCTPVCLNGYTTTTASVGFPLVCNDIGNFMAALDLVCTVNTCSGTAFNGVAGADFSSCSSPAVTGNTCTPVCRAGFTQTRATLGFKLVCDGDGNFDAAPNSGRLLCSSNTCDGSVSSAVDNADYSACSSSKTDDTCTPVCLAGYTTTGTSGGFLLVCGANGDYDAALDSGDLGCAANICGGAVANPLIGADFSVCAALSTGDHCTVECLPGYTTSGADSGFDLVCDASGNYDAAADTGNLVCSANSCRSVTNRVVGVDYSTCTASTTTGDSCTPVCRNGYTTTGASTGLALVCAATGGFDAATDTGNLGCSSNICNGIVSNGVVDGDYSACATLRTDATCTPVCPAGYRTTGASNGFVLVCSASGNYDAAADSGNLQCTINTCSGNVLSGLPGRDYSSCATETTGATCVPTCRAGFATSGAAAGFALVCSNNGDFAAAAEGGDLQCAINSCTGSVINGVVDADYSSCSLSDTDDACTPVCPAGFTTTGATSSPTLVCEDNGDFDVADDSGNLACTINSCSGSVRNGVSRADYSSCASSTTGDTCTPVCQPGHTTTGASDGFVLLCEDDGDFNAASDTGDLACSSNICNGVATNVVENADYSLCSSSRSGDICTPLCKGGFTTTGASGGFVLVCDQSGDFDGSADNGNLVCTATTTGTSTTSSRTLSIVARFDCETYGTPIQVLRNAAGNGYEARALNVTTGVYATF
jgi:hypothetical protein